MYLVVPKQIDFRKRIMVTGKKVLKFHFEVLKFHIFAPTRPTATERTDPLKWVEKVNFFDGNNLCFGLHLKTNFGYMFVEIDSFFTRLTDCRK